MKEEQLLRIVNKQFLIIGEKMRFENIPDSGYVEVGKKKIKWYELYKFTEEQEQEWKGWTLKELKKEYDDDAALKKLKDIEMKYGFVLRIKKGTLF